MAGKGGDGGDEMKGNGAKKIQVAINSTERMNRIRMTDKKAIRGLHVEIDPSMDLT